MSNLPQRLSDAASSLTGREIGHRGVPARIERAVNEAVAVEHGRAIIHAARARGVEYVATEALQAVAGLSALEGLYLQQAPLGEARYRSIADTAAVTLATIVADTGRA